MVDRRTKNAEIFKDTEHCSNQAKAGMNPKTLQYLMGIRISG